MKTLKQIGLMAVVVFSLHSLPGCEPASYVSVGVNYVNPPWAPPYYARMRYYYIPDIEVYYDLSDQEFVYLDNGQWLFSAVLPPIYGGFDLYNCYVVALDRAVFQPWLHHHYYVSHYPRYYYRSTYHNMDIANIRGFNENDRKPIYWKQDDRNRINDLRKNEKPVEHTVEKPKPPQQLNYYGKQIGQPVKVRSQMRENNEKKRHNGARH